MIRKSFRRSYKQLSNLQLFRCVIHKRTVTSSTEAQVKPFNEIPGLTSLPVIGPLHHFLPYGTVGPVPNFYNLNEKLYYKYGPIVRLDGIFSRANMVILYDPADFEQVYRAEEVNPLRPGFDTLVYYRSELRKSVFKDVQGLTTAQGLQWRDFRTKVNPALLKPKLIKLYAHSLDNIAEEMVARLVKLKDDVSYLQYNFDLEVTKWSLESIALVGLGTRIGCLEDGLPNDHPGMQLMETTKDIIELAYKLEFKPSLWRVFATPNFKKMMKTLDLQWNISEKYIEEAKKEINERGHDIPDEDKSIIEKLLVIDEKVAVMMANEMLFAGIDTVAFSTIGLLYHLAVNQNVQEKLRQEIQSGESPKRYLRACLKESLRIWPVISANLRTASQDHIIAGYYVPKGVDIIVPNEFLSKMEKYYPRPLEFLPERWLTEKSDPLYHASGMITLPFGFGVRSCIGRRIAELEIEVFVSRLLDTFKITWDGPPIKVVTKVMNTFEKPYYFKFNTIK